MTSARAATLQDVADLSGVSRGTASRALTGEGRVSAETRTRVHQAAKSLRYSINRGARNLRQARAGSIGLSLPAGMNFLNYYMDFAVGVVESTNDKELTVSLIPADFPASKAGSLHVDGFVMTDVVDGDALARAILETGRHVVVSEPVPPGMPSPSAMVLGNHSSAMGRMLDRLKSGGATSIAVVKPPANQMWVRIAAQAAAEWGDSRGVPVTFIDLAEVPSAEQLNQMIRELRAKHPDVDAIVCLPEGLGVGILSTVRELGLVVPDDMQIVSYTDGPTMSIVQPPISSMDLRAQDAGRRAGHMLISLIEGAQAERQPTIEEFDLIYRERSSTRPSRA